MGLLKNATRIAGLLFLIQLITYFLGNQILLQKIVSAPRLIDFLPCKL